MDKTQQENKKKAETEALAKRYDELLKHEAMLKREEEKRIENLAEKMMKVMTLNSQKKVRFDD